MIKTKSGSVSDDQVIFDQRTAALAKIIKPLRSVAYCTDTHWSRIESHLASLEQDFGTVDLCPDFQRGHVWTSEQQKHYIENVLRGIVSTAALVIQLNCPNFDKFNYSGDIPRGLQCIDGLQRLTAVMEFMRGSILPFGLTLPDLELSSFSVKNRFKLTFQIFNYANRADLLSHYLAINAGGTQHSSAEIERVRSLRASSI